MAVMTHFVKTPIALCFLVVMVAQANAFCLLGVGNRCPIDSDAAAKLLMQKINRTHVGSFNFKHSFLFDTLRLGKSEPKSGDNIRRLTRANIVQAYINDGKDCSQIATVWDAELSFHKSKQEFCEFVQLMKIRNLATLRLSLDRMQPNTSGGIQEIFMRLVMTDEGASQLDRFLLSRDDVAFTVATGALNFLHIVRNDGRTPVTGVEFQFEIVPNVWSHIEKRYPKNTLSAERKMGRANFKKNADQWELIDISAL
jgi:hypothetical protein